MGSSASNAVNLGDGTHAANSLGGVTITGTTGLTIDDTVDSAPDQTMYFEISSGTLDSSLLIDYSGATLSSLTFDAGTGGTAGTVQRTPTGLPASTAMVLNMGTSPDNAVSLGRSEADALGNVTVAGDTGLAIDDGNGFDSWTIAVTATATAFDCGGPVFDYGGATLSSLSLNLNNNGGNTVDVTSTPSLPAGTAMSIGASAGSGDVFNLGDSAHAASLLGNIDLSLPGDGTATLTIDDFAAAGDEAIGVSTTGVTFEAGEPTFDYTGQKFSGLTIHTSNPGGNTIDDTGAPASATGLAPLTLIQGAGGGTTVNLGDASHAASGLGDVTITSLGSRTELTVDDTADAARRR